MFSLKYKQTTIVRLKRKYIIRKIMKSFIRTFPHGKIRYQYDPYYKTNTFVVSSSIIYSLYFSDQFKIWKKIWQTKKYKRILKTVFLQMRQWASYRLKIVL